MYVVNLSISCLLDAKAMKIVNADMTRRDNTVPYDLSADSWSSMKIHVSINATDVSFVTDATNATT